ncbi:piggyBac transposable element-derived protein 4-like [Aricia agestis]|uniref:piggyBac transposable element-derived protein 4-like n=1 Tax=Aricia agestis TaxID=91739 RepID=UPI001C20B513|nr:piggyBac transposable element-derived protein 4-like [Aricia agestis]
MERQRVRVPRGRRTRGGQGGGLGVPTRGGAQSTTPQGPGPRSHIKRKVPGMLTKVTSGSLESIKQVQAMETPLSKNTRSRDRSPAKKLPDGLQSLWSSFEEISPVSPAKSECSSRSSQSTPQSTPKKRPSKNDSTRTTGKSPATRRRLKLAGPSSSDKRNNSMSHEEKAHLTNYGSDEESNSDNEDEDLLAQPVLMPRTAEFFVLEVEEEIEVSSTNVDLCFNWPPHCIFLQPEPSAEGELEPSEESEPEPSAKCEAESSAAAEPIDKFDFKWREFPQTQTPPELRREAFVDMGCGPTVRLASPYEAFTAIWDRQIMEHIAVETNRYAQQVATAMINNGTLRPTSRITKWQDTDVDELYVYFAIIMATGILVKTRTESYWNDAQSFPGFSDLLVTPGFSATMSFTRFHLLSKCLHFNNNNNCNPDIMTRSEAKLFKMRPIFDHLNERFPRLYHLSRNIALDESLTKWKGRLDIKQFIPNKTAGVGIKTYEICESKTGYLWRFEVHAGHEQPSQDNPSPGIVNTLVLRLLDGLEHRGHTVWMDNYYNSPTLARELKSRGLDCVGTLRLNRQFVPTELANLTKKDLGVGQMLGCTSGDVDLMVWRDKNIVPFISTYHGFAAAKSGSGLKPSIVPDYNVCMGGVDRKDQMLAMYPLERRRGRVWYKKFFRRLLNASILNAYILLRTQTAITHRSFRETLVRELIAKHLPSRPAAAPTSMLHSSIHCPGQYDFVAGKCHERPRRCCVVCKKRTSTYCKSCNVPLCVFTCFEPHHTRKRRI